MRGGAILCFVVAAVATAGAIKNVEAPEHMVGYVVGSILVPIALLICGLVLWGKAKKP